MSKRPWPDRWREVHAPVMIGVPMLEELKAEAAVNGCSIGAVIEAKLDGFKHMMMPEKQLLEHLQKYHPEAVHEYESGSDEDMADMEKEHLAGLEYRQKVEEALLRQRQGMRIHRIIAGRKALESRSKKAEVEA
jgi:hypothetical protein